MTIDMLNRNRHGDCQKVSEGSSNIGISCPKPEIIVSYAAGFLDSATHRSIAAHLGGCVRCRNEIYTLERAIQSALDVTPETL